MKFILIALLILAPVMAKAASLEESYLAARNGYVVKIKALDDAKKAVDDALKLQEQALDELGKLMRPIVGPVAIEGFPAEGKSSLDSLFKGDLGFGLLDGLIFSSADGKTHVIVTTDTLFEHWLREHKDWWGPKIANVPQQVNAALTSEAFYTQALQTDAAIQKYLELPVVKPAKAKFAFAMLVARTQTLGPRSPDELLVAVVQSGRVFVVSAPANAKIDAMPACQKIWDEAERKAIAAQEAYIASQLKDEKASKQRDQMEEQGDAAFRRCFAERAKRQGFFAGLTRQAQALIDRLPAR